MSKGHFFLSLGLVSVGKHRILLLKHQKMFFSSKKEKRGKSQPRKIQFLPTSCWLNFSAPIFFVWLLHIFARTQTKETPSDLCTFDLAIGLFVFLGYFFFLFLLISPHCGYFFLLLSLGSWVFMVNFPSKWMLFCLHSNS